MPRLYLVRHGRASAGFGESMDPGLDALGSSQAQSVATRLAALGPLSILCSPLLRTRETAVPLAKLWCREPVIEPAVAEIPSTSNSLQERALWLRAFMAGSWRSAPPSLAQWRETVISTLAAQEQDAVIFSHYVAINVAVGAALGDDRVVVFSPDNCSVTIVEAEGNSLRLVEKGHEAPLTKVN